MNAGAHIQHHYFLNSAASQSDLKNPAEYIDENSDPLLEVLTVYDGIIGEVIDNRNDYMIATGLSQVPYDREKYYYRLRDHKLFLQFFGVPFSKVLPRMTRDFEIYFENTEDLEKAENMLSNMKLNAVKLFGEIEIRSHSIFVTLTYPDKILSNDKIWLKEKFLNASEATVFVAIKNGMHCSKGYVCTSLKGVSKAQCHVANLKKVIINHFTQ